MDQKTFDTSDYVVRAIDKYADMIRRVTFLHLKNRDDVEDIFQEVFLQLLRCNKIFDSEAHEKAWLLRVAINKCKDLHKSFFRKNVLYLEDFDLTTEDETDHEVLRAVLSLPKKYKDVIYLFYYEGYTVSEISGLLDRNENTIYSQLHRAKTLLKIKLED
ncbi:sigma-70 family RNA polymerase sigma factor [Oscillospiraceae bacterium CM]|nr:sigma-70 family RNA polymerase sigma factor [Oscillospiraceae bacterium CM]